MKINKKYLLLFFGLLLLTVVPNTALAADKWIPPTLQIPIPTLAGFSAPEQCDTAPDGQPIYCVGWIGEYIGAIYKYAIGIIGIVAAIALMIGGVRWLTAGGNPSAVKDAQSWITGAITGLIIGLTSYLILYQINPNLVIFKPLKIKMVKEVAISTGSNDRLINCSWQTSCQTGPNGMKIDESGKCGEKVGDISDPNVAAQVCCCHEKPLPNCQWEADCSAGREPADGAGCGTFYGGLAEKCCCSKTGTTDCGKTCAPLSDGGLCDPSNLGVFGNAASQASAICKLESGGNPKSSNTNKNGSIDTGIFQINDSHCGKIVYGTNLLKNFNSKEECRKALENPEFNAKVALAFFKSAGWSPWTVYNSPNGCKNCW
ncbi:MAG: transglycosylase SLT domain-containing protein [Patescibacteria group bacterium]|jgi:hypothetical protein